MRALVTGGAGYLGTELGRQLLEAGFELRSVDVAAAPEVAWRSEFEHRRLDLRHAAIDELLADVEVVFHLAFAPPRAGAATMFEVNVGVTRRLLAGARRCGVAQSVILSSTIVEHEAEGRIIGSGVRAREDYRTARRLAEAVVADFDDDLEIAVVRPKTFIGPGRVGGFALVYELVRNGARVPVLGEGENRYQMIDVRDLAAGLLAIVRGRARGVVHFGAASFGTVNADLTALIDYAATGSRLLHVPSTAARVPLRVAEVFGSPPLSEWHQLALRGSDSEVSLTAARSLGWRPQFSNAEALIAGYSWYKAELELTGSAAATHPVPRSHRLISRLLHGPSTRRRDVVESVHG